ncbi:MAG: porin [Isosphaeraceae bacterium]
MRATNGPTIPWMVVLLAVSFPSIQAALAQTPPVPAPSAPASSREAELEERLRRLESRYEAMSRQNAERYEELNRRYRTLVETLGAGEPQRDGDGSEPAPRVATAPPREGPPDDTAPSVSESAVRPSRSGGPIGPAGSSGADARAGDLGPNTSGGDDSAPSVSESASRPSRSGAGGSNARSNLLPLQGFYDQKRYGYLFQFGDQEFELRLNSLLQVDGRVYEQRNQNPVADDLNIPRARMYFSGRITRPIEYQISLQRGNNTLDVLNAYVNFNYDTRLQFRIGRFKSPFTYEWYKMTTWEFFAPERSPFALNFGPNRQLGLMGWGFLFDERLEYSVALTDGPRNSYGDFNSSKDVMALVDYKPFFNSGRPALKNFGIGGSVDAGRQNNPLVPAVLRTSANASASGVNGTIDSVLAAPFLAFNNNVRERGDRALWELHATYFYKGFS